MNTCTLIRDEDGDHGTFGLLRYGELRLHIAEPPWRDNQPNLSCVPPGRYNLLPHVSPRFGRCLLVAGVRGRSHILVHAGNVGGDKLKGLHTHTLGCLLPGLARGSLLIKGVHQRAVLSSRTAMRYLLAAIYQPITIDIGGERYA